MKYFFEWCIFYSHYINMANNHLLTVFCCSMTEIEFLQNVCMGAEILLFVLQKNTK